MRVIVYCFIVLFFTQSCKIESEFLDSTLVVQNFIDTKINQRTFDIRTFDPPPPPELRDSITHNGRIKPDSIIEKLAPLQVFLNKSIGFDNAFKPKAKPIKGFDFINSKNKNKGGEFLKVGSFTKKKGIVINSFSSDNFDELFQSANVQEGYGGFISFKNLYYSKDGQKAYFEFIFYRRKLNSSTSLVYAEKQDNGLWKFIIEEYSIS